VVTPLALGDGRDVVLVNRGWVERGPQYPSAPPVSVPAGTISVDGIATRPPARYLELSGETVTGDVWQNLSIERYGRLTGLAVLPIVVLDASPAPGLVAVRETPDAGVARHHEYALTWFSLAVTVLVLWLVVNTRRVR
jgi:surfeit locus 1 family protein